MKINTHPTKPPLLPIPTDPTMLPFQSVSMDFITDLPLSNHYDSIMVVVDHDSSKGIILIPCTKTLDALGMAKLYHDYVYKCFGLPKHIISDRGPQFASQVFQTLCTRLGIKSKLSTAYHPQTDGQTERTNQEVEAYLCIYCGTSPHSWADSLTNLEFSHNIQTHSVTKTSPFNIILGYDPIPIPPEFEIEAIVSHKGNGNRRRFLVKWTGYPSSKNQWLPETELSHAAKTLKMYKKLKNL
ncbi:hypothetical protein M0805_008817 [Coniferiporia weirii]|nr:hypothetical protein M0805_008817 [Coniferiporia weirii]